MSTAEKASENNRAAKKSRIGRADSNGKEGIGKEGNGKHGDSKHGNASLIEQNETLKTTLQQIEKQFGEGSIMPLGADSHYRIEGIPTGSLSLDIALGGQGIPRGRIIEIFGPESSGKTTLALHCVAQAQKREGIAAFIDAEHA